MSLAVQTPAPLAAPSIDWAALEDRLNQDGFAIIPALLSRQEAQALTALYAEPEHFRSRVIMERHGYGRGEYQYFCYPLPETVQHWREALYPPLARIANRWQEWLDEPSRFAGQHEDYLRICHEAGQVRPTPLLLRYGSGDYNCLHQDLYGAQVFPLQVAVLLSQPGDDFTGGEFVLTEQRPRQQSRAMVATLQQGDAIVFAVNTRPTTGSRGYHRVHMRHGVSRIHAGTRHTLGIIFHDAT